MCIQPSIGGQMSSGSLIIKRFNEILQCCGIFGLLSDAFRLGLSLLTLKERFLWKRG
jgi:hypothetical protein